MARTLKLNDKPPLLSKHKLGTTSLTSKNKALKVITMPSHKQKAQPTGATNLDKENVTVKPKVRKLNTVASAGNLRPLQLSSRSVSGQIPAPVLSTKRYI
jgi:hypothetical protein